MKTWDVEIYWKKSQKKESGEQEKIEEQEK